MKELPPIIIDTREQLPYAFEGYKTERRKLDAGDYSLVGYEGMVAVERKSLSDAYGCVGGSRRRFVDCLERLASLHRAAIVIESTLAEFAVQQERTRITPAQAVGSYIGWACRYRIPVFFCGSREYAERVTIRFLAAYLKLTYTDDAALLAASVPPLAR